MIQLEEDLGSSFVVLDSIDSVLQQRNALAKQRGGAGDSAVLSDDDCSTSPTCISDYDNVFGAFEHTLVDSPMSAQATKKKVMASPGAAGTSIGDDAYLSTIGRWSTTTTPRSSFQSSSSSSPMLPSRSAESLTTASSTTTPILRRSGLQRGDSSPLLPRRPSVEEPNATDTPTMPRRSSKSKKSSSDSSPSVPRRQLSPCPPSTGSRRKMSKESKPTSSSSSSTSDTDPEPFESIEYKMPIRMDDDGDNSVKSSHRSSARGGRLGSPRTRKSRNVTNKAVVGTTDNKKTSQQQEYFTRLSGDDDDDQKQRLDRSSNHSASSKRNMRKLSLVRCKSSPELVDSNAARSAAVSSSFSSNSISRSSSTNDGTKQRPRRASYTIGPSNSFLELVTIPESPEATSKKSLTSVLMMNIHEQRRTTNVDKDTQQRLLGTSRSFEVSTSRSFEDFKIARKKSEKQRRIVSAQMKRKKSNNSMSLNDLINASRSRSFSSSNVSNNQNATWGQKTNSFTSGLSNDRWRTCTAGASNSGVKKTNPSSLDTRLLMAKVLLSQSQPGSATAALLAAQKAVNATTSTTTTTASMMKPRSSTNSLRASLGSMAPGGGW